MDIRSRGTVKMEESGDERVTWLVDRADVQKVTTGSFVDFVVEVEVRPGGSTAPHDHPAHEWFYLLAGHGVISVGDERCEVGPGDCVYIPPGLTHMLTSVTEVPIRMLAFGVAPVGS